MDIKAMLSSLRSERQRLDQAISALEGLDGTPKLAVRTVRKARKRGVMSPAARKRMSEMMKARWASQRKAAKKT